MELADILTELDEITSDLDNALTDESIMSVGKVLSKIRDKYQDLASKIQEAVDNKE